jgi:hypothetical protein
VKWPQLDQSIAFNINSAQKSTPNRYEVKEPAARITKPDLDHSTVLPLSSALQPNLPNIGLYSNPDITVLECSIASGDGNGQEDEDDSVGKLCEESACPDRSGPTPVRALRLPAGEQAGGGRPGLLAGPNPFLRHPRVAELEEAARRTSPSWRDRITLVSPRLTPAPYRATPPPAVLAATQWAARALAEAPSFPGRSARSWLALV